MFVLYLNNLTTPQGGTNPSSSLYNFFFFSSVHSLMVADQTIVVTEGNTSEIIIYIDKDFQSDLPIAIYITRHGSATSGKHCCV